MSYDKGSDGLTLLDKLPKKIRQFDAFPKTQPAYRSRSSRGGAMTLAIVLLLSMLFWGELRAYIWGEAAYSFDVEHHIGQDMQINVDMTVAMQCHYLTIDVRDAVGDRLHISDSEFKKDGTTFDIGHAGRLDSLPTQDLSLGKRIDEAREPLFRKQSKFKPTSHVVNDGPACRIYGSVEVKKVTGNLHITTLGHGYWSWEHTDHAKMNLSHVIHEFSFGPYFPAISQPLDSSVEVTTQHFKIFQYFLSIVPTKYIDKYGRQLSTNQYSVTDYTRTIEHGQGVPGLFFKYDVEPMTMTIMERTTTLAQFLVRLAGILGGVWVCASYTLRAGERLGKAGLKVLSKRDENPEDYAKAYSSAYSGHNATGAMHRGPTSPHGAGPTPYGATRSTSGRWIDDATGAASGLVDGARDGARQAWGAATYQLQGGAHRKTESVQQRIFSEEGRAPW